MNGRQRGAVRPGPSRSPAAAAGDAAPRDAIFGVARPVLFAHRGGAAEVPESTEEAFRHAAHCGADVLELDVQLTRDGAIAVWHGPSLDIAHDGTRRYRPSDAIWRFEWQQLRQSWVTHPDERACAPAVLTRAPQRRLLALAELLDLLPRLEAELADAGRARTLHLNVELKPSKRPAPSWDGADASGVRVWDRLFALLERAAAHRRVVIASAARPLIARFRDENRRRGGVVAATNLAWQEQLAYRAVLPGIGLRAAAGLAAWFVDVPDRTAVPARHAVETSYALAGRALVDEVHRRRGAVYVFLTRFTAFFPAIDGADDATLGQRLRDILATGVDGIMTDYPAKVARLLGR